MLTSLALIFLVGLATAAICQRIKLPRIIGMLVTGAVLGPYVLDLLDPKILGISAELRQLALVIILIKAGLSLDLADLKKVGRPAVLMAFIPASLEIIAYILLAPPLLGLNRLDAAIMGTVLGAVSPAVVVPRMVQLIDSGVGTKKHIPQMLVASASCDNIYAIVFFGTFTAMAQAQLSSGSATAAAVTTAANTASPGLLSLLNIPLSIVLGVLLGLAAGFILSWLFRQATLRERPIRDSNKVIIILGLSFALLAAEALLKGHLAVSGLLAIITMASLIRARALPGIATSLAERFGKLWLAAELLLFVLVGAAVDIRFTLKAGLPALILILLALIFRSLGVLLALARTKLDRRERLFCVLAYLPKATVQAAIGSVPLALGLGCGPIVLAVAVMAIVVTAPLGALGIDIGVRHLLSDPPTKS